MYACVHRGVVQDLCTELVNAVHSVFFAIQLRILTGLLFMYSVCVCVCVGVGVGVGVGVCVGVWGCGGVCVYIRVLACTLCKVVQVKN